MKRIVFRIFLTCALLTVLTAAAGAEELLDSGAVPSARLTLSQKEGVCTVYLSAEAGVGSVQFTLPEDCAESVTILTEGYSASGNRDSRYAYVGFSGVNDTFVAAGTAEGIPADTETAILSFALEEEPEVSLLSNVEIGMLDGMTAFDVNVSVASPATPDFVYGDVNDDGLVNTRDSVLLSQYLAFWNVPINGDAADVNADGVITEADALFLRRYLAGWNRMPGQKES